MAVDSNIVGYQLHDLKAGANLMGVAWEGVTAVDGKIALSDMMDTTKLTSVNADGDVYGDYVQVWEIGSGWGNAYYYIDQPSWNYDDVDYSSTWMDGNFQPCNPEIAAGQAFWLFLKTDVNNFPFKGQVAENGVITVLSSGPNLIANPLPRTINLADHAAVTIIGATSVNVDGDVYGDSIQTWELGSGWGNAFYFVNQPSWNYDAVDYTNTWMDGEFMPGVALVSAGSGFWYFAENSGVEITFKGL